MTIEIVASATNRIPVAVLPFAMPVAPGMSTGLRNPAEVVAGDLGRSGYFRILDSSDVTFPPADPQAVQLAQWKSRGADAVVIGKIRTLTGDRIEVSFWLLDAVRQTPLTALVYTTTPDGLRTVAHRIADAVHQALVGEPGSYSGLIAYILKRGARYELQVADADSQNAVTVTASPEPLISPAWSPDGRRLAYVSFEDRKPVVYVQKLADGSRRAITVHHDSGTNPAWSPDGRRIAVVLSKEQTSQIHLLDLQSGDLTCLTKEGGSDAEPVFSPDGQWLYFTSNRAGASQIYRLRLDSNETQQVTREGQVNQSPNISADSKSMTFLHRRDGQLNLAIMDIDTKQVGYIKVAGQPASPRFSNDGRIILYSTWHNGNWILGKASVDGRIQQHLTQPGDLQYPSYSPRR